MHHHAKPSPTASKGHCPAVTPATKLLASPLIDIDGRLVPRIDMPIDPGWITRASACGLEIRARVKDRFHLHLHCRTCGGGFVAKIFTLRTAEPLCPHCLRSRRGTLAEAAGLTFLHRDPANRHYGIFRAACGHDQRRQFELVERMAKGTTGLRCGICHRAREEAAATAMGWALAGPDPRGNASYRLYRHLACGHDHSG